MRGFAVERMRRGHRLDREAVEAGAGDLARAHGVEQRGFVDQAAARGVDEDHAALACRQRLRVDQLARCRRSAGSAARSHRTRARSSPGRRPRCTAGRSFAYGSKPSTRMPIASAMRAKRRPIAPRPTTPTVRPSSSTLLCVALSQWPACMRCVERRRPTWRRRAAAPAPARPPRRRWRRPRRRPRCRAPRPRPCRSCRCRCRAWRSPCRLGAASIAAAPTLL